MNTTNGKLFGIKAHKNRIRKKFHLLFMFCYPQLAQAIYFPANIHTRLMQTHPVVYIYIDMYMYVCELVKKAPKIYLVQTTTITHLKARARRS